MKSASNQLFALVVLSIFLVACSSNNIDHLIIDSDHSRLNQLQIDSKKEILVYTPPSYDTPEKTYPVICYLTGYTSPANELINGTYSGLRINEWLDACFTKNPTKEVIFVIIEDNSPLGGSFYTNSPNSNLQKSSYIAVDFAQNDGWITTGSQYFLNKARELDLPFESFQLTGSHDDQLHIRLTEYLFPNVIKAFSKK